MINKSTQLTLALILSIGSLIAWRITPIVSTGQMIAAQILSIGGYLTFRFIQKNKLQDFRSKIETQNKAATVNKSELRQILDSWSETELRGNLEIDWMIADCNRKPMYDQDGDKEDEYICVTGGIANKSRQIQVFVLASEKRVKENNIIRHKHMYTYPFKYSEYWQEYKKQNRYNVRKDSKGDKVQLQPGVMYPTPGTTPNNSEEAEGDE